MEFCGPSPRQVTTSQNSYLCDCMEVRRIQTPLNYTHREIAFCGHFERKNLLLDFKQQGLCDYCATVWRGHRIPLVLDRT